MHRKMAANMAKSPQPTTRAMRPPRGRSIPWLSLVADDVAAPGAVELADEGIMVDSEEETCVDDVGMVIVGSRKEEVRVVEDVPVVLVDDREEVFGGGGGRRRVSVTTVRNGVTSGGVISSVSVTTTLSVTVTSPPLAVDCAFSGRAD